MQNSKYVSHLLIWDIIDITFKLSAAGSDSISIPNGNPVPHPGPQIQRTNCIQSTVPLRVSDILTSSVVSISQGSYSIEKPLNLTACLENALNSHKAFKSP